MKYGWKLSSKSDKTYFDNLSRYEKISIFDVEIVKKIAA